jgi:DNA polymerase II small subunit/DNA polymerase delta subunit B
LPIKFSYNRIIGLSNPSVVEINGINILLTHNFSVSMLKKRYLGKPKRITEEDYLTIDEVPDIVLFNHHQDAQVTNYKSITIVNPGSLLAGTNVTVIDLATREVQQLSL